MEMDSVKHSQSDLCVLVNYGRPSNLFYFSKWGLDTQEIPLPEIAAQLQLLTRDQEVVFPTSFLLSPQGPHILEALDQLTCKKRLMFMLGDEEIELSELNQIKLQQGWTADILFSSPLNEEALKRLDLYNHIDNRLVYAANHLSNQFQSLKSIPSNWLARSHVTFFPPGNRHNVFLSADEVMLFQNNFAPRILSYKPINLTDFSFFSAPTRENYLQHFTTLGELEQTRHLIRLSSETKPFVRMIFAIVFYAIVRPIDFLRLPLMQAFYFLEFQAKKRLRPRANPADSIASAEG